MVILFAYFIILCSSQCMTDSTSGNVTTLSYDFDAECSNLVYNTTGSTSCSLLVLHTHESLYSEELIVDFLNYPGANNDANFAVTIGYGPFDAPNLQVINVKPKNVNDINLITYLFDNTHFYIGCFGGESGCESVEYFYLEFFSTSVTVYLKEKATQQNDFNYHSDNSKNDNGYPYLFFSSFSPFSWNFYVAIHNDDFSYDYFKSLSGSFYLFTSCNVNTTNNRFDDYSLNGGNSYYNFTVSSVCSRKDTNRYVIFNDDHTPYTNCSCWTKNNDTSITIDSIFNYPDCNYNSTMFDLILPSSSSTYLLSDDLLEWYSIIFTTSSQSVKINDGKTLTIEELDINQNDISFNENVYVKYLTISTVGASFNTLNFDQIDYSHFGCGVEIFKIQSTSTNLSSFNLNLNYITGGVSTIACEKNSEENSEGTSEEYNEDDGAFKSYFSSNFLMTILTILSIVLTII